MKHFGCRLSYALKSGSKDTPHSNRKCFLFLFALSFHQKAQTDTHGMNAKEDEAEDCVICTQRFREGLWSWLDL